MTTPTNITNLFQTAEEDGALSAATVSNLNVTDLTTQIQAALGVSVDDVPSSEVVLVTMMPDDSGSIRFGNNAQIVRDGHNLVLRALQASKQKDGILAHTRYLNGQVLFPYCFIDQAVMMDTSNYDPNLGTPLYDQTVTLLATVLVKSQEFADSGVPARTVTLIITDGADAGSAKAGPKTVASIVKDMLRDERHIIAAMGISDGTTDFRKVFREMGIPDQWILTPGNNAQEIRRAFQTFSQSAVRASQSAAQFGKAALGGFGAP